MAVFINHFEYSDPVHLSQLMAFLSSNTNYIGPLSQLWSDVLLIIRKVEAFAPRLDHQRKSGSLQFGN